MSAENKFSAPDFAYPKTVEKNARAELDKALSGGDYERAVLAAIQIVESRALVSRDSIGPDMRFMENLAGRMPKPWSRLLNLYEAQKLSKVYNNIRWQISGREMPPGEVPENPYAWDESLFRQKILSLVESASDGMWNADKAVAEDVAGGIAEYGALLDNIADAKRDKWNIADFIAYRCIGILSDFRDSRGKVIPFFATAEEVAEYGSPVRRLSARLADSMIESAMAGGRQEVAAQTVCAFESLLSNDMPLEYYRGWFKRLKDSPASLQVLCKLRSFEEETDDVDAYVTLLKEYVKKYPQSQYIQNAKSILDQLEMPEANLHFNALYVADKPLTFKASLRNKEKMYVLVYDITSGYSSGYSSGRMKNSVLSSARPVAVKAIEYGGKENPDSLMEYNINTLPPGKYAAIVSATENFSGVPARVKSEYLEEAFEVSGITGLVITVGGKNTLMLCNPWDMSPIANLSAKIYKGYGSNRRYVASVVTDEQGFADLPEDDYGDIVVESLRGTWRGNYYNSRESAVVEAESAMVFPDRSIYRPGDSIVFAAVAFSSYKLKQKPAAGASLRISLRNANYQEVDSCVCTTDEFGRAEGKFTIPESGLLGFWQIVVERKAEKPVILARSSVRVEEYKTPTFLVTLEKSEGETAPGAPVMFKGKAVTYSGMPLQGANVAFSVRTVPVFRWFGGMTDDASFGGETNTGSDGSFLITLPTGAITDTDWLNCLYGISATVTAATGETCDSPEVMFSLGKGYALSASIPSEIDLDATDGKIRGDVKVLDILGAPVQETVKYEVIGEDDKVLTSGEFTSPVFDFKASDLSSGKYKFRFTLPSDSVTAPVSSDVVLYRSSEHRAPVATPLWLPRKRIVAPTDSEYVEIEVGSGYPGSYILAIVSDTKGESRRELLEIDSLNRTVRVAAPTADNYVYVNFTGCHDFRFESGKVTVVPAVADESLNVEVMSFRNRLMPGDKEHWSFRFTYNGEEASGIPAMAVMTDKALNALAPFRWAFHADSWTNAEPLRVNVSRPYTHTNFQRYFLKYNGKFKNYYFIVPEFRYQQNTVHIRGSRMYATAASVGMVQNEMYDLAEEKMMMKSEAAVEESEDAATDAGGAEVKEDAGLRPIEYPVALFRPMLSADGHGVVGVDFEVPDFNTTWQFQILGYTSGMKGCVKTLDAVASKPVMVQMNAPRFVRTGDSLDLSATLFNNSDKEMPVGGRIEILDASTGKVIAEYSSDAEPLDVSSSRVISLPFEVPSDLSSVIVRVYAMADGFRDGEQTLLPVLPSSTPVMDSYPFYLQPGSGEIKFKLPKFSDSDKVTLSYCDNPVWFCITALPDITTPVSDNLLSLLRAYYGRAIATGLAKRYPSVMKALEIITADQADGADGQKFESPLKQNMSQKAFSLEDTPWVNSADAESERLANLKALCDSVSAKKNIEDIFERILALRNSDGGFSWCPDMSSSFYMTSRVLLYFSMLDQFGYLPDNERVKEVVKGSVKFADDYLLEQRKKSKGEYSLSEMLNYLYVRTSFNGQLTESKGFGKFASDVVAKVRKEWRDLGIYDKATAAIQLYRKGYKTDAKAVLASLGEYSTMTPEQGMWYDNLRSYWNSFNKLIITTQVLEAYAAVMPDAKEVDSIRQWLVLQRQTQDWRGDEYTAEVVQAILSSGSNWTEPAMPPRISVGGKKIRPADVQALTGSFTIDLPAKSASGKELRIAKDSASPSWGGVLSQYVAPISEVKAHEIPDLSITKQVVVLKDTESGLEVAPAEELRAGAKVRVILTLESKRDMDYVAITDERAACMEPVDALSGYDFESGVGFYREVRNSAENFFLGFLPKGTFVLSYDCYLTQSGEFSAGIATVQSQYAPLMTAHSAGYSLRVSPNAKP